MSEAIRTAVRDMGYYELRQHQMTVVKHFLKGKDVFVSLPMGSGKRSSAQRSSASHLYSSIANVLQQHISLPTNDAYRRHETLNASLVVSANPAASFIAPTKS